MSRMNPQHILCACAALALLSATLAAEVMPMSMVEASTVSPLTDMTVIDAEMKMTTKTPPVLAAVGVDETTPAKKDDQQNAQRHTVADFIIHPLIAFKPRTPEDDPSAVGKQAADSTSSTTPSPWQLFGFNAGQGLGSSMSSLAGSVTGWINDRIQLPGLVETPVRDQATTSTTSTTTPRSDVVVRVQQKASTKKPLISISNNRNGPNRVSHNNLDSEEFDDEFDDDDFVTGNINGFDDEEDDNDNDNDDDEEEFYEEDEDAVVDDDEEDEEDDEIVQRPNNRRGPARNQRRGGQKQSNHNFQQPKRRYPSEGVRRQTVASNNHNKRRRPVQQQEPESEEMEDDDSSDDEFYYGEQPSTKRSQSQSNFIQRGQQSLINQIRQLTRGQTPGEIGNAIRKSNAQGAVNRPRPTTLLINHNGQTYYAAPELTGSHAQFFQPPLSVPLKRKGRPTQYITIPWSQLGISPPDQLISITEGIQSQPLILNIPQSAILSMQEPNRKKKRPVVTPDAVPLFTEASLVDVFKPPKIPPSRTTSSSKPVAGLSGSSMVIASKPKKMFTNLKNTKGVALPQRIRPGTIVEKAPAMDDEEQSKTGAHDDDSKTDKEFILVGDDNEPGLTRQVQPVYGDARYVHMGESRPYFEVLPRGRYAYHKNGRALDQSENAGIVNTKASTTQQQIPVQVIADNVQPEQAAAQAVPTAEKSVTVEEPAKESVSEKAMAETETETNAAPPA